MDSQERQALERLFSKYQYLNPQECVYIRDTLEAWHRPVLQPAPRQCFGNPFLVADVTCLWERRAARLSLMDLVSNPDIDTTTLSEGHPIELLGRARDQFGLGSPPPFGLSKRGKPSNSVVVPSINERRPVQPTLVYLIRRSWDKVTDFWTLDLNGRRWIVSYLEGHRYHTWIGHDDFATKTIAFPTVSQAAPAPESSITHREPSISAVASIGNFPFEENAAPSQGNLVTLAQRNLETRPKNAMRKGFRPNFLTTPKPSARSKKEKLPGSYNLPTRLATESSVELVPRLTFEPSEPRRLLFPAAIVDPAHLPSVHNDQLQSLPSVPLVVSDNASFRLSEYKSCNTRVDIDLDILGAIYE